MQHGWEDHVGGTFIGNTRLVANRDAVLRVAHPYLTNDFSTVSPPEDTDLTSFTVRSMVVRKAEVVPIECAVRGYLAGSGWKEYQRSNTVCGLTLPNGLQKCRQQPEPLFTPSAKAEEGHDENISFEVMVETVGQNLREKLRDLSLDVDAQGAETARERGVILAGTKFEFSLFEGDR